jgi:hypothetical protein
VGMELMSDVDQRNVHSSTRGVWAKTNNQQ